MVQCLPELSSRTPPRVSVIISCYNQAHYLPSAVYSVLAQTFADWEAIIVDDGSTDDTGNVAAQFTDARIHYIHQENRGLSAARNSGIRAARGEYLAFLDADDEWEPHFLEVCLTTLANQKTATAVVTRARFIDETGVQYAGMLLESCSMIRNGYAIEVCCR